MSRVRYIVTRTIFPDKDAFNDVNPLLAYKAVSNPDTLYYHQAMKEHDSKEFRRHRGIQFGCCSRSQPFMDGQ
jgi:hypothetical protein